MTTHHATALRQLRAVHDSYFIYLARLFEHLTDAPHQEVITTLVNDTFYELWESNRLWDAPRTMHEWLLRTAIGRARRCLRPVPPDGEDEDSSTLTVEERAAIYLVYTGHTREQVAGILRLSGVCVDALLSQARLSIQNRYAKHQGGCRQPSVTTSL
ncbi:MAG TPA: hypothetical protein VHZ99_00955 [Steroidobacteraceae bacterium]|jgi:DNA-directed RNA polymerase specialized sigma24 family protein|nr:hypothetical protein [Steroidobacteraceae bacterium]